MDDGKSLTRLYLHPSLLRCCWDVYETWWDNNQTLRSETNKTENVKQVIFFTKQLLHTFQKICPFRIIDHLN